MTDETQVNAAGEPDVQTWIEETAPEATDGAAFVVPAAAEPVPSLLDDALDALTGGNSAGQTRPTPPARGVPAGRPAVAHTGQRGPKQRDSAGQTPRPSGTPSRTTDVSDRDIEAARNAARREHEKREAALAERGRRAARRDEETRAARARELADEQRQTRREEQAAHGRAVFEENQRRHRKNEIADDMRSDQRARDDYARGEQDRRERRARNVREQVRQTRRAERDEVRADNRALADRQHHASEGRRRAQANASEERHLAGLATFETNERRHQANLGMKRAQATARAERDARVRAIFEANERAYRANVAGQRAARARRQDEQVARRRAVEVGAGLPTAAEAGTPSARPVTRPASTGRRRVAGTRSRDTASRQREHTGTTRTPRVAGSPVVRPATSTSSMRRSSGRSRGLWAQHKVNARLRSRETARRTRTGSARARIALFAEANGMSMREAMKAMAVATLAARELRLIESGQQQHDRIMALVEKSGMNYLGAAEALAAYDAVDAEAAKAHRANERSWQAEERIKRYAAAHGISLSRAQKVLARSDLAARKRRAAERRKAASWRGRRDRLRAARLRRAAAAGRKFARDKRAAERVLREHERALAAGAEAAAAAAAALAAKSAHEAAVGDSMAAAARGEVISASWLGGGRIDRNARRRQNRRAQEMLGGQTLIRYDDLKPQRAWSLPTVGEVIGQFPALKEGQHRTLDGQETSDETAATVVLDRVCDEIGARLVSGTFRIEPDGTVHRVGGRALHYASTEYTRQLWYARLWKKRTTDDGDDVTLYLTPASTWDQVLAQEDIDPVAEVAREIAASVAAGEGDGTSKPAPQPTREKKEPSVRPMDEPQSKAPRPLTAKQKAKQEAAHDLADASLIDPANGRWIKPNGQYRSRLSTAMRSRFGYRPSTTTSEIVRDFAMEAAQRLRRGFGRLLGR
ncbi:hypothetical protein OMK64_01715 [Cellulomonas fimi]|uniref:hypothetical protein n=1 Tax=Cellulomonas fimi TaxID=1708 RepID=UPI00234C9432|nr:hypothetical protein [Cellulomonas fimi]MDC7120249.1 hypothetical protein [Cellulomonas fimi]